MRSNRRLETLDVGREVSSREGVSNDHLARLQLHFLVSQDRTLVVQTQFADAKAGALMALMGLLILQYQPRATPGELGAGLETLALGLASISLALALWAVMPRYPNPALRRRISLEDVYSWPGLASDRFDSEDYVAFMRRSEHGHLVASLARSNSRLAAILLRKFQLVRMAFIAGIGALVLTLIGGFLLA